MRTHKKYNNNNNKNLQESKYKKGSNKNNSETTFCSMKTFSEIIMQKKMLNSW